MCAQALIMAEKPSLLLNIGVAGALTDGADIADCVVPSSAVQHDMDTSPLGDPVEVNVRRYELSIRKADAEMIEVE